MSEPRDIEDMQFLVDLSFCKLRWKIHQEALFYKVWHESRCPVWPDPGRPADIRHAAEAWADSSAPRTEICNVAWYDDDFLP